MMKNILLLMLIIAGTSIVTATNAPSHEARILPQLGSGTGNNPKIVVLWATPNGWNADWSPNLNPAFVEFRGVSFSVNASWNFQNAGGETYDFAIYTADFPASSVSPQNTCNPTATSNSCIGRSLPISPSLHFSRNSFTATLPSDDFSGAATYNYFDEYHPTIGHGTITVYKSPDINNDGIVDIGDLATVAIAYKATPGSPNWNPAADLDNNGVINIGDLAIAALYYKLPI